MHVQRIVISKPLITHPVQTSFVVIVRIIVVSLIPSIVDGDVKT